MSCQTSRAIHEIDRVGVSPSEKHTRIEIAYFLPEHVHCCDQGDAFVFLDLRSDEYTLVNGECARALRALCSHAPTDSALEGSVEALNQMVEQRLLTTNPESSTPVAPTRAPEPLESLVDSPVQSCSSVSVRHLLRFVSACTMAAFRLRFWTLARTVRFVEERKKYSRQHRTSLLGDAHELARIFLRLRAFFPRNYLCLYDSLAMLEFLAPFGVHPSWVFAVTLRPWGAHCYVQDGPTLLNEELERALRYTPVMVI